MRSRSTAAAGPQSWMLPTHSAGRCELMSIPRSPPRLRRQLRGVQGGVPLAGRLRGAHDGLGLLQAPEGTPPGQVRAATFDTWPEELSWIADQIAQLRARGEVTRWAEVAVLTRRNADIAPLYAELTARDVPVEIVGLGGLLHLPEIMDITATLRLIDDVTANPDLIRLLTGPRWRVGPRDLGLLGRRARELARAARDRDEPTEDEPRDSAVLTSLERAVAEVDPTEVVSLLDALESPGEAAYSPEARQRFATAFRRAGMAPAARRRAGARPDPPSDHHDRP